MIQTRPAEQRAAPLLTAGACIAPACTRMSLHPMYSPSGSAFRGGGQRHLVSLVRMSFAPPRASLGLGRAYRIPCLAGLCVHACRRSRCTLHALRKKNVRWELVFGDEETGNIQPARGRNTAGSRQHAARVFRAYQGPAEHFPRSSPAHAPLHARPGPLQLIGTSRAGSRRSGVGLAPGPQALPMPATALDSIYIR
jgi:hypothetical protein